MTSLHSILYPILDLDGKSVRQRIQMINHHLPKPTSRVEAYDRARKALCAIGKMTFMEMHHLYDVEELTTMPTDDWTKIATAIESKFQGNINSIILNKLYKCSRYASQA